MHERKTARNTSGKTSGAGLLGRKASKCSADVKCQGSERYFMHYDSDSDGSDAAGDDSGDAGAVMVMLLVITGDYGAVIVRLLVITVVMMVL